MTTSTAQTLVIPGWVPDQVANGPHGHWALLYRARKTARVRVWAAAKQAGLEPIHGKARVTITLVFAQHRRRDPDNLTARVKPCLDSLVKGKWLVDDSTDWLELEVRAEVVPGHKETRITLEEVQS